LESFIGDVMFRKIVVPLLLVGLAVGLLQVTRQEVSTNVPDQIKQTVKVQVESYYNGWQGSGIFVADDLILTAGHMVEDAETITVTTVDGKKYQAISWYKETGVDLGIIVVETPDRESTLKFDNAILGEDVWAYGNPLGVYPVLTKGIISAIDMPDDFMDTKNMLITDCPINPGNSGCALFDEGGNILGICSWGYTNSQGMSYFVRSEICELVLDKYHTVKALEEIE